MANKQIHQYTAANTIDAAADYLLIDPGSTGIYKSINRNTLLALASAPVGLTDSQSPTNKVFDNTNSITVKDGSLTIQNSSSTTKQAVFSASGITAGQTRTFTFPDASGTLVTTAATQTLTAKTLTSPTITGGTIDNTTVTVDSISGHTVATTVTVANLQIANGVLNTANAVTTTSIAAGAIQPQALVSGTGSGWTTSTWAPSWTNLSLGNGVLTAKYIQTGKVVYCRMNLLFGTTTTLSGDVSFTLPVNSVALAGGSNLDILGQALFFDGSSTIDMGYIALNSTTKGIIRALNSSGTYVNNTVLSSTQPFTWGTSYALTCSFQYEAA